MREYLPTLGELIDRLTICQLKEVKIPNNMIICSILLYFAKFPVI